MTTNVRLKETALFAGPELITATTHVDMLASAFAQTLNGTKDKCFWSAAVFQQFPRSAIVLFPARVSVATKTFKKGLGAGEMAARLPGIMDELIGGPLKYIPQSEGHMVLGWEVCLDHRKDPDNKDDEGLPVTIVYARMCRP